MSTVGVLERQAIGAVVLVVVDVAGVRVARARERGPFGCAGERVRVHVAHHLHGDGVREAQLIRQLGVRRAAEAETVRHPRARVAAGDERGHVARRKVDPVRRAAVVHQPGPDIADAVEMQDQPVLHVVARLVAPTVRPRGVDRPVHRLPSDVGDALALRAVRRHGLRTARERLQRRVERVDRPHVELESRRPDSGDEFGCGDFRVVAVVRAVHAQRLELRDQVGRRHRAGLQPIDLVVGHLLLQRLARRLVERDEEHVRRRGVRLRLEHVLDVRHDYGPRLHLHVDVPSVTRQFQHLLQQRRPRADVLGPRPLPPAADVQLRDHVPAHVAASVGVRAARRARERRVVEREHAPVGREVDVALEPEPALDRHPVRGQRVLRRVHRLAPVRDQRVKGGFCREDASGQQAPCDGERTVH